MVKPFRIKKKSTNEIWTESPADFEIWRFNCGGLDVHSNLIVATVGLTDPETLRTHYVQQSFGTFQTDLNDMCTWLSSYDCKDVAMESTGKYMIPVCDVLEEHGITYTVSHPKYCKSPENHKDDWYDSMNICRMYKFNLIRASFIPPMLIRECRDLGRRYTKLKDQITAEKNRFSNCLTSCGISLAQALSDPFCKTGRAVMKEILSSNTVDTARLATLIDRRCSDKDKILKSVEGAKLKPDQCFKMRDILEHIEQLEAHRDATLQQIEARLNDSRGIWSMIRTIPGISDTSALLIISEIGYDMSVWNSPNRLAFWAGLTPGSNSSNGKKKSSRITKAGHYLKPLLVQCALAAVKSISDPYFRIKYQRLVRRRGKKKAIIAIARMLLVSIYHIIETGEVFNPSDHDAVVNGTKKRKQQSREAALTKSFTVQELLAVCASYGQNSTQQISAQELLAALTAQTVREPANAG